MKNCTILVPLVTLFMVSCSHAPTVAPAPAAEHYIPDPDSVGFDIEPIAAGNAATNWLATYSSGGKVARFRIEVGSEPPQVTGRESETVAAAGHGSFVAEPGSDGTVFVAELAKALKAKRLPKHEQRLSSLGFDYVNLGEHESQSPGGNGGFFDDPAGNWVLMKVFVGKGGGCEFFLNINPAIKKGQISMKDEDYGDCTVAELAKVL